MGDLMNWKDLSKETRLEKLIEATGVGTWEWNYQTGDQEINERWAELIGYDKTELAPVSIHTWEKYCHPEDLIRNR